MPTPEEQKKLDAEKAERDRVAEAKRTADAAHAKLEATRSADAAKPKPPQTEKEKLNLAIGYPNETVANLIKDKFCLQVVGQPGSAIDTGQILTGISAVLEDTHQNVKTLDGDAIAWNVVLTRKGKRSTHPIAALAAAQLDSTGEAYRHEVKAAVDALKD